MDGFLFWLFVVLAILSFVSMFLNAKIGRATMMVYSLIMVAVWVALAAYFGGYLGEA